MTTATRIGRDELIASFSGTRMPENPGRVDPETLPGSWPRAIIEEFGTDLTPAGVLIPVIERPAGLTVLLTERAAHLKHHGGQVSFPGGRMEASDRSIVETALRETHEEVGIEPSAVRIVGHLRTTLTITGYAVSPAVGLIETVSRYRPDPNEVAAVFEVPLDFLLDETVYERSVREFRGLKVPILEFRYGGQRVWGATALMLSSFIKKIKNNN